VEEDHKLIMSSPSWKIRYLESHFLGAFYLLNSCIAVHAPFFCFKTELERIRIYSKLLFCGAKVLVEGNTSAASQEDSYGNVFYPVSLLFAPLPKR
jgi:hypothetical protein